MVEKEVLWGKDCDGVGGGGETAVMEGSESDGSSERSCSCGGEEG